MSETDKRDSWDGGGIIWPILNSESTWEKAIFRS